MEANSKVISVAMVDIYPCITRKNEVDTVQVRYICEMFRQGMSSVADVAYLEPLLIRRSNVNLRTGNCDLIEVHGCFSESVANAAILALQKSGELYVWANNALAEAVKNEDGIIIAIRFTRPGVENS